MLTPDTGGIWFSKEFLTIVLIGMSFFIVGIVVAALISGHKLVEVIKQNSKVTAALLFLMLAIPLSIGAVQRPTSNISHAATEVQITNLKTSNLSPSLVILSFDTTPAALVFIQYRDSATGKTAVISPTKDLTTKVTHHEFAFDNLNSAGGTVTFVINGKNYLYNNQPYPIQP